MLISIIVPVAREGEDLHDRIRLLDNMLSSIASTHNISYEILLVTDVPHKPTLKAMMRLAKQGIARSFLLTRRIGKGGSVKNVVPYARGDVIVLLDADIPIRRDALSKALATIINKNLDLLVANRIHRPHGLIRRILSIAYNNLVRLLFRTGLRDHQAGFKILSRRAALILTRFTRTDGLGYDTELIVWAKKHKLSYHAMDMIWHEKREQSTIPPFRAILTMLADLIVLRLLTIGRKYVALQRQKVGRMIELPALKVIDQEHATAIKVSGLKRILFNMLRKIYLIIAFSKRH